MASTLSRLAKLQLAPPAYLVPHTAGIDVSASGIKVVTLAQTLHGLKVKNHADGRPAALKTLARAHKIRHANVSLPESLGHIFEATVPGSTHAQWCTAINKDLGRHVPSSFQGAVYDIVPLKTVGDSTYVVGIAYPHKIIEETRKNFSSAGTTVHALESEASALARAVLPHGDTETVLIIDLGKTTTKLFITTSRIPRFTTTLDIGGHALTLAAQKHFGVTEEEARRVKAEKGLVGEGNKEYLTATLSTVSSIRDQIIRHLDNWQTRSGSLAAHAPVTRAILVGGNATLRGLPEYLGAALKVPVALGDVFTNFASRADWLPPMDHTESLAYGTAIGLSLREHLP